MRAKDQASERFDVRTDVVRTPEETAKILRLSEQELVRLTKEGVLPRTMRKLHGRMRILYDWEDVVPRYITYLDSPHREAREAFQREKGETQRIVRAQKELELAFARGELVKKARVINVVVNMVSTIRNHVLGIASRCARQVVGQTDFHKVYRSIDEQCRLALRDASSFDASLLDEPSRNGKYSAQSEKVAKRVARRRRRT